jgi:hypothetical protein
MNLITQSVGKNAERKSSSSSSFVFYRKTNFYICHGNRPVICYHACMNLLLILVILLLLFYGGGFYLGGPVLGGSG